MAASQIERQRRRRRRCYWCCVPPCRANPPAVRPTPSELVHLGGADNPHRPNSLPAALLVTLSALALNSSRPLTPPWNLLSPPSVCPSPPLTRVVVSVICPPPQTSTFIHSQSFLLCRPTVLHRQSVLPWRLIFNFFLPPTLPSPRACPPPSSLYRFCDIYIVAAARLRGSEGYVNDSLSSTTSVALLFRSALIYWLCSSHGPRACTRARPRARRHITRQEQAWCVGCDCLPPGFKSSPYSPGGLLFCCRC